MTTTTKAKTKAKAKAEAPFATIATNGLGHVDSTLAHSMCTFEGTLYLGTSAPRSGGPEDCGRIFRREADKADWVQVYSSPPLSVGDKLRTRLEARSSSFGPLGKMGGTPDELGREYGIRSMTVYQGKSDPKPCLYCGTLSLNGGQVLRSEDGETFEPVTEHGLDDDRILSFRGLVSLNGWLFAAPSGTVDERGTDSNAAPEATIYCSADPAKGIWALAAEASFGDPQNNAVFSLAVAHGWVYAGTANAFRGFQIWRTKATGKPPFKWEKVLTDGAYRYNHNLSTSAMREFNGDLYIGSGMPGLGYDSEHDVGPAAGEMIRLREDGSWDLIFGELRCTPDGLKPPLSGYGPGMNDPYNSVIWVMNEHKGRLYFGTHNWEPFDWAMNGKGQPVKGGYQLWSSADGEAWTLELENGNGSNTSVGVRTLHSTPEGLFVGTCVHTKLIQMQARIHAGLKEIGNTSDGFDILLGR